MRFDPADPPRGQRYFFHYTGCPSAEAICDDGVYHVGNPGRSGAGMYVTDIVPDEDCFEALREHVFDLHPPELYNGVVVVVDSDPPTYFFGVEERVWIHDGSVNEDIQLEGLALAHACWDGEEWAWRLVSH